MRLVLNGRFLGRPITGVERLAMQLTQALRTTLAHAAPGHPDVAVLVPPDAADRPDSAAASAALGTPPPEVAVVGGRRGHAWEQVDLPRACGDRWLLSLCNIGPMLRRRQAVVICDALFIDHPESFSFAFRWWYRTVLTVLGRRAAAVFTISDFSKAALERHRLVPRGKTHVLRLGVDHMDAIVPDAAVLDRLGLAGGRYILAIGSLTRHKNLSVLVDAFVAAGLDGVSLVVAGGGNSRIFQDAGLRTGDAIHYAGRVSDAELKALYGHALAFACPSLSEGFGFTPLEAMTTGCPVVATTGGAVPEVCGDAALYADPHDTAAWSAALRRIVEDDALRGTLAARARERARTFTWAQCAVQMLTVLARTADDRALLAALAAHPGTASSDPIAASPRPRLPDTIAPGLRRHGG